MAGALWVNDSGVHFSPKLSQKLRYSAQPMLRFRAFTDKKDAFGKGQGDSFNWDKVANLGTIGGLQTETNTANRSSQAITKGTLTVNEYMNSMEFTFKLEALSQFQIENIIDKGLRDDMVKVLDAAAYAEYNASQLVYVGTATAGFVLTTNGTATATNTSVLNEYHIRKMALELDKRNVPQINGGYVFIGALEAIESAKGAMVAVQQYNELGYERISDAEVGMIHGVRLIKENNATRYTYDLTARTRTAKTWTGAQALEGVMFGGDSVTEAVAVPEQIRAKEVTDYGRSKGLAWYFLGGWKIEWSDEPNSRIVRWQSAA